MDPKEQPPGRQSWSNRPAGNSGVDRWFGPMTGPTTVPGWAGVNYPP